MGADLVGAGGADRGRRAIAGEQRQSGAGGVVEGSLEFGKDPQQQRTEAVDAGNPLPHQVRAVGGQEAEFGDDIVRCRDRGQVAA